MFAKVDIEYISYLELFRVLFVGEELDGEGDLVVEGGENGGFENFLIVFVIVGVVVFVLIVLASIVSEEDGVSIN